jgi:hypothetical protein
MLLSIAGCGGITHRSLSGFTHPSGVVRARAVSQGEGRNEARLIPALIERLNDPDPVVQLTANEELKRVTGRDFGFANWLDADERSAAVARWRAWWEQLRDGVGKEGETE